MATTVAPSDSTASASVTKNVAPKRSMSLGKDPKVATRSKGNASSVHTGVRGNEGGGRLGGRV